MRVRRSKQSRPGPFGRPGHPGYTLVEMLIVVVILAILAGVAFPAVNDQSMEARIAATQNTLRTMYTALDLYRLRYSRGSPPPQILPGWFAGNAIPANPMAENTPGSVQLVNLAGTVDPTNKVFPGGSNPFWYNAANGILRARVPSQPTPQATTNLYNLVNGAAAGSVIKNPGGGTGVFIGGGEVELGEGLGGGGGALQLN